MSKLDRLKDYVFKLNLALLVFVICICVVEGVAWRVYRHHVNDSSRSDKIAAKERAMRQFDWVEEHEKNRSRLEERFRPDGLWGYRPLTSKTINILPQWGGVRKTVNPEKPEAEKVIRVFIFGGSTTFCGSSPDELTLPSLISRELNGRVGDSRFELTNFGQPAYVNDQEIERLVKVLIDGGRPDWVIFYDGYNDTATKVLLEQPHFRYDHFCERVKPGTKLEQIIAEPARHEYVHRLAQLLRYRSNMHDQILAQTDQKTRENAQALTDQYRNNIEFVRKLGQVYDFKVYCFWQPTLYTTSKPLTNEESPPLKSYPSSPKRKRVFRIAREVVVERLAEMPGFYDVTEALDEVKESIFIDQCHISPVGNQAIAAAITNRLLAAHDANLQPAGSKTRP